jgi:hypothetical protein
MALANIIKFANDTKCWKIIESVTDMEELQQVLDNLCKWADTWGMCFDADKCKVMHIGKDNPRHKYYMKGTLLGTT